MDGPETRGGEFDLIARIRSATTVGARVSIGIGDDCAAIRWPDPKDLLVTTDMLMDGRHFVLGEATPEQIGFKAMGVNLSDIAAMAGEPIAAVVAVALPREAASSIAAGLHAGLKAAAEPFGVDIVGGDTNGWDGALVISVTLLGRATERGPVKRSGARPGDGVYVTGPLGGSLLGRHLTPRPRIREALALHEALPISAMLDISDGLASDLGHIVKESGGLGAVLDSWAIPVHDDARRQAKADGRSPLEHALTDGEDFELCLTIPGKSVDGEWGLVRVGKVVATPGLFLREPGGGTVEWTKPGFDHLKR